MTNEKDENGILLPNEKRHTKFGRFLRSTSFDELPGFINVLKGDMSIIGPRPLKMEYINLYKNDQVRRHEVKPGITGWAQVNGRNVITFTERFKMDVWYVDNKSFLLDLKILWLTFYKVIKRENINPKGSIEIMPFDGTN
jgi:sugar transferase EpsL